MGAFHISQHTCSHPNIDVNDRVVIMVEEVVPPSRAYSIHNVPLHFLVQYVVLFCPSVCGSTFRRSKGHSVIGVVSP